MQRSLMRLSILAATLAVGAGTVAIALQRHEAERLPKAIAEKAGLSSASLRQFARAREAELTDRTVYDFKRTIRAKLSGKPLVDLTYSGKLYVDEIDDGHSERRASRLSFTLESGLSPTVTLQMIVDPQGSLIALQQPKGVVTEADSDSISILKDLASILAYASEEDTLGRYSAKFTRTGKQLLKSKLRYEESRVTGIEILKSRHVVEWSTRDELPLVFSGEEITRVGQAGEGMETFSQYRLSRESARRTIASAAEEAVRDWEDTKLTIEALGSIAPRVDWREIQARLGDVEGLGSQPKLAFFHQTLRSLKQHPEKIAELKDWILKSRAKSRSASFGIGVLATFGTPEAQKTLREIYAEFGKSAETLGLQHTILSSFTTTEAKLEPETRGFLNEIASAKAEEPELAMNAAFAIGSAIKKEPSAQDERKLMELAEGASDLEEKLAYIDAIGNSGSENLLPALEQSLHSDNERLRAKAVFALRWMKTESAMKRAEEFLKDSSPIVRTAAEKAIRYQRGES